MASITTKVKQWVSLIKEQKLNGLHSDIKAIVSTSEENCDKYLCRLLPYIAHLSEKCNKKDYNVGIDIWKVVKSICSVTTEIQITENIVASFYYIIQCLLNMELYNEAKEICNYLLSRDILNNCDKYLSISYLWFSTANILLQKLTNSFSNKDYNTLLLVIEQDFRFLKTTCTKYAKYILGRLGSYFEKVNKIKDPSTKEPHFIVDNFRKIMFACLQDLQLSILTTEKFETYKRLIDLVNVVICINVNETKICQVQKILNEIRLIFMDIVDKDLECERCFKLYMNLCFAVMKPSSKINESTASDILTYVKQMENVIAVCGNQNAVMLNSYAAHTMIETVCDYWSKSIKIVKNIESFKTCLINMIHLSQHIANIMKERKISACCENSCKLKLDFYNGIVIELRILSLTFKWLEENLSEDLCSLSIELIMNAVSSVYVLKQENCNRWLTVWKPLKTFIQKFGILCEQELYEKSIDLFSLLCSGIAHLEETDLTDFTSESTAAIISALRRLAYVYYTHKQYKEALATAAFGCLFSYKDPNSKIFRLWRSSKRDCLNMDYLRNTSMVTYLKKHVDVIQDLGLNICIDNYDLRELSICEIKCLQESQVDLSSAITVVLDDLENLNDHDEYYIRGVQLFGLHVTSTQSTFSMSEYITKALTKLKKKNESGMKLCFEANLAFFTFVNQLNISRQKTEEEMKISNLALRAVNKRNVNNESDSVVPTYTNINVKKDAQLMKNLKTAVDKWRNCFKDYINEICKGWQPNSTLQIIILSAEYSKLYNYRLCEVLSWKLAYVLADVLNDQRTCISIVGNCISSRIIKDDCIMKAQKQVECLKDSQDVEDIRVVGFFWVNLADYYFQCNKLKEANQLLNDVKNLTDMNILTHPVTYLKMLLLTLENYKICKCTAQHVEYSSDMVNILYSILSLHDMINNPKRDKKDGMPSSYSSILDTISHISLNVNGLLAHREITAHLLKQLEIAQRLSSTLRVSTILKILCFLDLFRFQLDDCEVKLEGLEHILDLETFQLSMHQRSKNTKTKIESSPTSPIRDVGKISDRMQGSISPVLPKKVFGTPSFLQHDSLCICYKCSNPVYQSLVFSSTHIRAQLYALKNYTTLALEHFEGALKIRSTLFEKECNKLKRKNEDILSRSFWLSSYNEMEYVQFLLDYSQFMKKLKKPEDALKIALDAINICHEYNLESRAVYITVQKYLMELYQITDDYSKFTVPAMEDINVDDILDRSPPVSTCVTPNSKKSKQEVNKSTKVESTISHLHASDTYEKEHKAYHCPAKKALQNVLEIKSPVQNEDNEVKECNADMISSTNKISEDVNSFAPKVLNQLNKLVQHKIMKNQNQVKKSTRKTIRKIKSQENISVADKSKDEQITNNVNLSNDNNINMIFKVPSNPASKEPQLTGTRRTTRTGAKITRSISLRNTRKEESTDKLFVKPMVSKEDNEKKREELEDPVFTKKMTMEQNQDVYSSEKSAILQLQATQTIQKEESSKENNLKAVTLLKKHSDCQISLGLSNVKKVTTTQKSIRRNTRKIMSEVELCSNSSPQDLDVEQTTKMLKGLIIRDESSHLTLSNQTNGVTNVSNNSTKEPQLTTFRKSTRSSARIARNVVSNQEDAQIT